MGKRSKGKVMRTTIKPKHWIMLSISLFIIFALGIIFLGKERWFPSATLAKRGVLADMIGVKESNPQDLPSFQEVKGVIDIQHWQTKNGVPVYFVHIPALPMVDVEIVFDAGAARNGVKGGLAYLTNTLLAEGTATLTADQIAENFEDVGAQFNVQSQRDMASITLRSLSDPTLFAPALETMAAVISQPSFPEGGFQRERQSALTILKKQAQSPSQVASKAFYTALYPNQPYANWILGDENSLQALTADDIKLFHQQYYVAKNATVAIVGNVSALEANAIAERITEGLAVGQKAPPLPAVINLAKTATQKINFPSAQTHILMGEPLIKQGDPDYYALYLGNHILGGNGSVTRIFNTIRNQHGLAYSAYSHFQPMRERGPYVLGCQTRNDQAEKALSLMKEVLKEYIEKGPTQKELEDAKLNVIGGYALHFDSNAAITQQVASLGFYGLPLDHFDKFKQAIDKLTIEDIQKTFQKRVSPDNVAIIMVGQSESKD